MAEKLADAGAEIIKGGYPIFNPEEGQYLANTLGEPLIKGLTEVAHVRPKNPVVHLANYLLVYSKAGEEGGNNHKRSLPGSATRALTGKGRAQTEGNVAPEEGDNVEERNEENAEPEGTSNREEMEERKDEDVDSQDDDNASISEDPADPPEPAFKPTNRDEHGQTILHFAAARSHGRNAIFQLLQEMDVNVGLRDGLYRTARDIAEQTDIRENVIGIDKFVVAIAARGENDKLTELLLEGYDHILDAEDGDNIIDVAKQRDNAQTAEFLGTITAFEERREKLLRAIRFGSINQVKELFRKADNKRNLAVAKNQQGRCSLHVAVLAQQENIVEYIASRYPTTLHIGDNLMRSPLHYAMGVEKVEPLSRILIAAGAQRVVKDLKGRQPSYYFMNKSDIQKLLDEEESLRV
ncbi:Dpy-30 motif [Nesidiocoris tenuis]|uniref:Dpy-30 motif n=1 Tax=Nesidiocoris tenuis TaxID=355587 RepID=A0ABN7AY38_9HEMI|nr:Dpy-30 motif [Nesidiocoris tenuis]